MRHTLAHIAALSPYALAKMDVPDGKELLSLSQNESLLPPSPKAQEAAALALRQGHLYPDPDWQELRAALADHWQLDAESILCGAGSMELINALARAYAGLGDTVLAPAHAYPFFRTATALTGADFITAPEENVTVSVDGLLSAVTDTTAIVFVANPGNPTGTRLPSAELRRLRRALPNSVLLVIDEAYGEFADHLDAPVFDMAQHGGTVVLRTFSKAYALAGLRVGWGVFPNAIARDMRKVLLPNSVSVAAQSAALAALKDQRYMQVLCDQTAALRDELADRLSAHGFDVIPSFTNFVLVRFPTQALAASADAALRAQGIVARGQAGAGLPRCLRISIGAAPHMALAGDILLAWAEEETL